MKVSKVGGLPEKAPPVPKSKTITDWGALAALLEAHPNEPVLVDEFTQTDRLEGLVSSIRREAKPRALRRLGGTFVTNARNSHTDPTTGRLVGDLWVTYVPKED